MSHVRDQLAMIGINGPWQAAKFALRHGLQPVYLARRPAQTGKASQPAAWYVVNTEHKTNPNGHWRDYGWLTFTIWGRQGEAEAREQCIEWASHRYGIESGWTKVPGLPGTLWPKVTAALIKNEIRMALAGVE